MGRLFWKFFFAFWCALVSAGLGVWLGLTLYERAAAGNSTLATGPRASFMADTLADLLSRGDVESVRRVLQTWGQLSPDLQALFIVDAQGQDLLGRPVSAVLLERARGTALPYSPTQKPEPWFSAVREAHSPNGSLHLVFAAAADRALDSGRPLPVTSHGPPPPYLPLAAGLLASLVFSALLAWHFAKPVRLLRWALGSVAAGRLETRIQPLMGDRRDEIADLGRDFDRMTETLQHHIAAQRRLLHDVSHELRSPLARLQAAIGLARQDPAKMAATLDRIEREGQRLDRLVGEILTLARLEAGPERGPGEVLDLAELLADVVADARFEAHAVGKSLQTDGLDPCPLHGHVELLHRALENILRNAVSHTAPGTTVEVRTTLGSAAPAGRQVRITVCDRGPGVPSEELEAIFSPFHRAANCQSGVAGQAGQSGQSGQFGQSGVPRGGFGLGLAIARRAVEAHRGAVRASNREGGGLCVEVRLPLD
ncbi:sensor histidine kinase [Megalodesulfovibrio gigas]|uniref:histidine kinase n=1 Tax=Megalodesulfovibrio gigas (strain ATCC 19364 / DSM 1382 / NCIMB 9332 / VKM B-1759) TaxID=1121448 RepID=T2G8M1_MEGG1|nr:ATP-binding protein [Megalodesulfovibrio gigas]AGW12486.1 putative two component sensor histidine kinase [Megalodesulfovibrio gigas DSM 1382 = ATCC 19364]